jgi:hypothetical protein
VLVKFRYCLEHRQAGAGSTFSIVVVRFWPTKIGHHAVAKVLGDTSAEALDGLCRRAMVLTDDLAPQFGIEMAGDLGRAKKVAEKHRQMPPLACNVVRRDYRSSRSRII